MNEENQLGNMLASMRKRKGGWTQEQTAAWLEFARHTYSDWETGKRLPSPKQLQRIATKFQLSTEDEDALYRAASQEPPKMHTLPFPQNPFFTGRKTHLEQLGQLLQENGSVALTQPISISGLGGIGKTQIALEYAYRSYPNVYRTVLWVNAADRTTLQADYVSLAQILELPEQSVQDVKRWLERHTNWLLIMDNADDLELARSFFPRGHRGHILLTTRSQFGGKIGAMQLEIDMMKPEEGLVFLLRRTDMLEAEDMRGSALQLVELLDGHPLALDQAGAYIEETGVSLNEYINLYYKQRRDLLNTHGALDREHGEHPEYSQHPETVVVTFKLCFTKARGQHPLAAEILHFCAFLLPDAIPEELFQHDDSFKLDALEFNAGIAALQRYSLVKRNRQKQTLSMHRLVQAVLLDDMPPDLKKQWQERVVRALDTAFPATALFNESLSLILQGQYSIAHELMTQTVSIFVQYLGVEHHNIASFTSTGLSILANRYFEQGEYTLAESLYQQSLAISEKGLGAEHPYTCIHLYNLAMLYMHQHKYGQAEPLLEQVHSIRAKQLGAEHPDTVKSLAMLARVYYEQAKYERAELLYRRVLRLLEQRLGTEHPDIALPLFSLAMIMQNQGQHEQAEALYKRALSILEPRLEPTHPQLQVTRMAYAKFLLSIGRDAEAPELAMYFSLFGKPPV